MDASSPEEAAAEYWTRAWPNDAKGLVYERGGPGDKIAFARVEVEGHGDMVARVFWTGLVRRGGVRRDRPLTLAEIATALRWTGEVNELVADGWECEETTEAAEAGRRNGTR